MSTFSSCVLKVIWDPPLVTKKCDKKWALSHWSPPVSDKKVSVTKHVHFLMWALWVTKKCLRRKMSTFQSALSAVGGKWDVENTPKCTRLTLSLPHDPAWPSKNRFFPNISRYFSKLVRYLFWIHKNISEISFNCFESFRISFLSGGGWGCFLSFVRSPRDKQNSFVFPSEYFENNKNIKNIYIY